MLLNLRSVWPAIVAFPVFSLLPIVSSCAGASVQPPSAETAAPEGSDAASWPRLGLRVGGAFLGDFDTELRLDSRRFGRGTTLDFEDDLGFESTADVARADLWWRIDENRRHRIELSWFDISRRGQKVIDREIQWGDEVIPVSAGVDSRFRTKIWKLTYCYNFLVRDTWELGASVGVHGLGIETSLQARNLDLGDEFEAELPMPLLGLHGEWLVLPRVRVLGSAEALYVEINDLGGLVDASDLEGYVLDLRLGVEWEPVRHVGLGLGYNFFELDVSLGEDLLELSGLYRYQGLLAYVSFYL